MVSPENQGVFKLLEKATQQTIVREDWTTVELLVVALFSARLAHDCPACMVTMVSLVVVCRNEASQLIKPIEHNM